VIQVKKQPKTETEELNKKLPRLATPAIRVSICLVLASESQTFTDIQLSSHQQTPLTESNMATKSMDLLVE
jgi:hypothetical protein